MKVGFIGIGVQKAATSWLHDVLMEHPQAAMSDPKELDFFTRTYDRGYHWYERHFDAAPAGALIAGECSPSYIYDPAAPERVKLYNPDMRLIVILRDPVSRAFSNHLHEIRTRGIPDTMSFEDGLKINPMYLEQGRYATHMARWLKVFDREALLVLVAEDIAEDPASALAQVYAHIGVPEFRPDALHERRHESVQNRNEGLQAMLKFGGDRLRGLGLGKALEQAKKMPGLSHALALNKRDLRREIPKMKPETRIELEAYFADEMRCLPSLIGRDSLPWQTWQATQRKGAA
ncbi:MAG: sulfotransferase [Pseudomonadota bacterium]